ncbi:HalD/BesD family halogenase [Bradyrhizobium japonicum]|uniref:HalD/BesD family halogenase n=1 Tax=Bradyrhizobium japonicum TaxID=375 RepID=UPI0012FDDF25|nr:hypothetical protein [Bradyrhizobium japonicum]
MLRVARDQFRETGFVRFERLLTDQAFYLVSERVVSLKPFARHQNFTMPGSYTPRIMATVGGTAIKNYAPYINGLYRHSSIIRMLNLITEREVYHCLHPEEFAVVNYQAGAGQTHGWHFDDPDLALVFIIRTPTGRGGHLEIAYPRDGSDWKGSRSDEALASEATLEGRVQIERFTRGDAYLLYASKLLHRVAPLEDGGERAAVCMAFSFDREQVFGASADLLYGAPA